MMRKSNKHRSSRYPKYNAALVNESSDRRSAQYTMPYARSQKALPPPVRNARQCHLRRREARQR